VARDPRQLVEEAAHISAAVLRRAIEKKGTARLALATGASQLDALSALTKEELPWHRVEVFQVCERVGLDDNHPGSGRKALKDRFVRRLPLGKVHYLDGSEENMQRLNRLASQAPMDLVMLGMGERGQVGFNAAPADFQAAAAYLRNEQAVTLTLREMMRADHVIVCAPYAIHAENVWQVMMHPVSEQLPATLLKHHPRADFLLDVQSAAQVTLEMLVRHNPTLETYQLLDEAAPTEE